MIVKKMALWDLCELEKAAASLVEQAREMQKIVESVPEETLRQLPRDLLLSLRAAANTEAGHILDQMKTEILREEEK